MAKPSPTYSGTSELVALGAVIRDIRLALGLSQEALANEVGIDRSYMGGIERGEHNLAMINLVKIANTLNLSAAELLKKAGL
ncbi:helix-turn-helix domain-containing protein [Polynucleobacter sp. es-EL-1]|uniref:helix-turn-helix domain-containing protein n=1 Tax=Polynucleobacter sp. es-EL-1 TaxID=1855652 RepID=UPI001BFD90E1|nr:helix-turn-helix transcriptional regulator [Polynucleobacter sp. es-EL-1]QWE11167.1 helix-turn-helix transcriptional regulator [Polynucleobacter sp. es-EL-1]